MNKQEKEDLQQRFILKQRMIRLKTGIYNIFHSKKAATVVLGYITNILLLYVLVSHFCIPSDGSILAKLYGVIFQVAYIAIATVMLLSVLALIGTPQKANQIYEDLWRIGLTNHAGEAPFLIRRYDKDEFVTILEFDPNGIPLTDWQNKKDRIETALNVHIVKIAAGDNKRRILLHTVSGDKGIPNVLHWKENELHQKDFTLVLGHSFAEKVSVDLSKVPHILLGGSTGSGKSVLLKSLVMQCVKKDAAVYIADFKGGVDFSPVWHERCKIITQENELLDVLTEIVTELENRKILLKNNSCANISEYNKTTDTKLKRIIFACDEVAEVLDKTGLSKEAKELVTKIEGKLSIIARQGRAFGIHLILATQRPDANILTGQIRNNIDYRVCGRADNVLSQIILDNTDAADQIPKDAQGLFINHEGTVFRGFLFDESTLNYPSHINSKGSDSYGNHAIYL